jgi:hypothetical protein
MPAPIGVNLWAKVKYNQVTGFIDNETGRELDYWFYESKGRFGISPKLWADIRDLATRNGEAWEERMGERLLEIGGSIVWLTEADMEAIVMLAAIEPVLDITGQTTGSLVVQALIRYFPPTSKREPKVAPPPVPTPPAPPPPRKAEPPEDPARKLLERYFSKQ